MMYFIEVMSKADREEYRNTMRDNLIAAGGRIYVNKYLGIVTVIEPCIPGSNCKSFRVAAAYCNSNDKFRKSTGEAIALYRLNSSMCNVIRCDILCYTKERMNAIARNFACMR